MDKFLLAYIKQRMRERGYRDFHFEPLLISANKLPMQIKAYNEFYYLTGFPVGAGIQISSDTNVFRGDGGVLQDTLGNARYNFFGIQEFTGLIEITQVADIRRLNVLEFIYVVPTCKEKFCVKRKCCDEKECDKQ